MSSAGTRSIKPSQYPIVIKEVNGSLILYCPDLEIYETERIEELTAESLQRRITRLWGKIQLKVSEQIREGKEIPTPSRLQELSLPPYNQAELSIKDVAKIIGCSDQTVRRLVHQKKLDALITPGGHRRFTREAIDNFIKLSRDNFQITPK